MYHYCFICFGIVLESRLKLCMTELNFLENIFFPQNWENGPKIWQKQGFLNLLKNLVINFFWICSVMKIFICCVPAQISYLGKFLFLIYGAKYYQPIIAGFLGGAATSICHFFCVCLSVVHHISGTVHHPVIFFTTLM